MNLLLYTLEGEMGGVLVIPEMAFRNLSYCADAKEVKSFSFFFCGIVA
jgi:hypothetical protein